MMYISPSLFRRIGYGAVLSLFAVVATPGAKAQQRDASEGPSTIFKAQPLAVASLVAANDAPAAVGYSSSAGAPETDAAVNFMAPTGASPAMQPPPRRYGRRPIYADSAHNADGSNKYTFFGGAGFTLPTGGTHAYFSPSYDFQAGGGRNFNNKLALLAEFDWHNFGIQRNTLNNLLNIYQNLCGTNCTGSQISQIGGHAHVWSFSVDPQYTFAQNDRAGAYVIGGVGFYHKVTNITTPGQQTIYDPYYGYITYNANVAFDTYVSNAVGYNGGAGFTYKPSRFGNQKFFAEARYVYTGNSARPYYNGSGTNPTSNANYFNVFPQNSAKTTYIPVTIGVRF